MIPDALRVHDRPTMPDLTGHPADLAPWPVDDRRRETAPAPDWASLSDAEFEARIRLSGVTEEEKALYRRMRYAGRTIGARTARDLRHGDAPPQLAGAFLTAEGPTVLYARGGTGKGLLACWFVRDLVRAEGGRS